MEHKILITLVLLLGNFPLVEAQSNTCPPPKYFSLTYDWVLEDHVAISHKVSIRQSCESHCIKDQRCRSFNFQIKTDSSDTENQCEINYSTKNRHPRSLKKRPGWVYEEIKGADSLPILDPVVITRTFVWVEERQDVTLVCDATGQPLQTVTWSKAGGKLGSNSKSNGGELTLSRVTPYKDDGTYTCKVKNVVNAKEAETKVTVVPLLRFTTTPPANISAPSGCSIRLDCQGTRFSNVTWQRERGDLPAGHLLHANGTLVLLKVSKSGSYVCTVKTAFNFMNATSRVKITRPESDCTHLKAACPSEVSGNYVIDPDGEGGEDPFEVYCNMTDKKGVGVAVISHDREAREHVTGCEPQGCFKRDVKYTGVTIAQLAGLTRVNLYCEQFIMFECHNDVAFIERQFAWWVSREGKRMYYWGGATPGSGQCACAINDTCVGGGRCNCKNKDNTGYHQKGWHNDSGLLTDKLSLPVIQLRFGDLNRTDEEGYYTLGKFKCFGLVK